MKKHSLLCRITTISTLLVSLLMIGFLGWLFFKEPVSAYSLRPALGSAVTQPNVRSLTADEGSPTGVRKEYLLYFDEEIKHDCHLVFYSLHHYVDVYLGDELLYSLQPGEDQRFGKTLGANWVSVPLYPSDTGKYLQVVIKPVYSSFIDWEPEFLIGSQYSIYVNLLRSYLVPLFLSSMTFFAGILLLCLSIYNHFVLKRFISLTRLGIFSMLMGLWELCDLPISSYIFPQYAIFFFYTSIAILMLGFIPLMHFMSTKLSSDSSRLLDIMASATAIVAFVQLVLQLANIIDFRESLMVTHIMLVLDALCMLGNVLYDHIRYPQKNSLIRSRHLYSLCVVGILLDLITFLVRGSSVGLVYSLAAFLLYVVFTSLILLLDYADQIRQLKEQELELVEKRLAITLSQIRPHFIYNSLGAIRELCRQDPEEAREAITAFTTYLRGNMDSLQSRSLIHFEKELSHVQTYLKLEQLRFGESLRVSYELKERDFFLPSLTLQPLVENAVKHGICVREEGGRVHISTERLDNNAVVIRVADDGVGFDASADMGPEHIGIANVTSRLQQQAGASLSIESTPGIGTVATVTLPQ